MIPFLAALSRALVAATTARCAASSSLARISFSACVTLVLAALLMDLLRSRFLSATRADFCADLLLGNPASFRLLSFQFYNYFIFNNKVSSEFASSLSLK